MTDDPSRPGDPGPHSGMEPVRPWFPPSPPPGAPPQPPDAGQAHAGGHTRTGGHTQSGGWQPPLGNWPPPGGPGLPGYGGWPAAAPKPGVIPLRPLAVGEILDGAFTTIRRNPKATLGLAAAVLAITAVFTSVIQVLLVGALDQLSALAQSQTASESQALHDLANFVGVGVPAYLGLLVIGVVADIVLTGLLTVVVGGSVLGGDVTASEAWRSARPRLAALLGVVGLTVGGALVLAAVGVGMVVGVVAGLAAAHVPGALVALVAVFLGLALVCVVIWLAVMFKMASPAVMLEQLGPVAAMGRSWRLVRGSAWRVFGIWLLTGLIVAIAGGILQLPFTVLALIAFGGIGPLAGGGAAGLAVGGSVGSVLVGAVGGVVAGSVTRPIAAGVTVLLYVDLRIRREGFDLVLQGAADGEPGGGAFASIWRPGGPGGGQAHAGQPPFATPNPTAPPAPPGAQAPPAPGGPPTW